MLDGFDAAPQRKPAQEPMSMLNGFDAAPQRKPAQEPMSMLDGFDAAPQRKPAQVPMSMLDGFDAAPQRKPAQEPMSMLDGFDAAPQRKPAQAASSMLDGFDAAPQRKPAQAATSMLDGFDAAPQRKPAQAATSMLDGFDAAPQRKPAQAAATSMLDGFDAAPQRKPAQAATSSPDAASQQKPERPISNHFPPIELPSDVEMAVCAQDCSLIEPCETWRTQLVYHTAARRLVREIQEFVVEWVEPECSPFPTLPTLRKEGIGKWISNLAEVRTACLLWQPVFVPLTLFIAGSHQVIESVMAASAMGAALLPQPLISEALRVADLSPHALVVSCLLLVAQDQILVVSERVHAASCNIIRTLTMPSTLSDDLDLGLLEGAWELEICLCLHETEGLVLAPCARTEAASAVRLALLHGAMDDTQRFDVMQALVRSSPLDEDGKEMDDNCFEELYHTLPSMAPLPGTLTGRSSSSLPSSVWHKTAGDYLRRVVTWSGELNFSSPLEAKVVRSQTPPPPPSPPMSQHIWSTPGKSGQSAAAPVPRPWEQIQIIDRQTAEKQLGPQPAGSFLVRPHRSDKKALTLSFVTIGEGDQAATQVQHAVIRTLSSETSSGGQSAIQYQCGSLGPYASLAELLMQISETLPQPLLIPLDERAKGSSSAAPSPNKALAKKLRDIVVESEVTPHSASLQERGGSVQLWPHSMQCHVALVITMLRALHLQTVTLRASVCDTQPPPGSDGRPIVEVDDLFFRWADQNSSTGVVQALGRVVSSRERQLHAQLTPHMLAVGALTHTGTTGSAKARRTMAESQLQPKDVERSNESSFDFALQQMLHVKSGVEFVSARTSNDRNAPVAACFTSSSAAQWLHTHGYASSPQDASRRLSTWERQRVILHVAGADEKSPHGASAHGAGGQLFRYVDPWEVHPSSENGSADALPPAFQPTFLGRRRYVTSPHPIYQPSIVDCTHTPPSSPTSSPNLGTSRCSLPTSPNRPNSSSGIWSTAIVCSPVRSPWRARCLSARWESRS